MASSFQHSSNDSPGRQRNLRLPPNMGSGASVFVCGSVAARNVTTTRNLSVEQWARAPTKRSDKQWPTTRAVRLTTFILFVVSSAYLLQLPQVVSLFPWFLPPLFQFLVSGVYEVWTSYILKFCFCLVVFDNVTKTLFWRLVKEHLLLTREEGSHK